MLIIVYTNIIFISLAFSFFSVSFFLYEFELMCLLFYSVFLLFFVVQPTYLLTIGGFNVISDVADTPKKPFFQTENK